ncbi:MAG: glycosyltransferase family 4 protein [Ignavibacteriales bacterium]
MRIWLITVGEPLPVDGGGKRLLRTGLLAAILCQRGHDVVWWTSTFDHTGKRHRANSDVSVRVGERLWIQMLHSVGYRRNVSLRRVVDHWGIARKFSILASKEKTPDIILCSLPTLELSVAAAEYGRSKGVPVVVDIRDMWPDSFLEVVPRWGRQVGRLLLSPMFEYARRACSMATAITGITPTFVDWGVGCAGRRRSPYDRDFPMGYSSVTPAAEAIDRAEQFWTSTGIRKENGDFIACFLGAMGRQFDLETVISAARSLSRGQRRFRFVLCGDGESLARYRRLAEGCASITFPGWVGAAEIWALMRMSSVGLAPYRTSPDFEASLPNKPIEYLSSGLPVVTSLGGVLGTLLSDHICGVKYGDGDPQSLEAVLVDLYDHPERVDAMSANAVSLYRERFVAEKVYAEMAAYLEGMATPG